MRVLLGLLVLQLLFLLNFMVAVEGSHKYLPLPPLFAKNIKHFAKEPSGLTYCASTDRLYLNCDKSSCHYIYEMDTEANPIETLEFSDSHHDIEAIACNDKEGYLYIAEEGHRKVQAFYLDDYSTKGGQKQLKEAYSFRVVTGNSTSSRSGLEGMTVNTKTGDIYVANEKGPAMIVRCHENGEQYESNIIEYARDISGLAYDDQLDLLWVLSDQNEQVFLTDLTGTIVYDYWDLPVANPEGIAINNNAKPPKLYIATDPSAPSGPQYVPLVLGFDKPENGTGYATWDHKHLPKYVTDPPPCHGCHDVFEEAYNNGFERAYYWEDHFPEAKSANLTVILVSVLVPIGSCCLLAVLAVICAVVIARRMKRKKGLPVAQEDPDLENELVFTSEEKDSSLMPDETEV